MLMDIQAIDRPVRDELSASEYRRALQRISLTQTGYRLGLLPLFVGMRVRLTAKITARFGIMQDTVGVIEGVDFHPMEFPLPHDDWRREPTHEAWARGHVRLRRMPKAVMVRVPDFDRDVGFGYGIIEVEPSVADWEFHTHDDNAERTQRKVKMIRRQLPFAPERIRTVQTAQGISMDSAAMHLARPPGYAHDDHWLHVYVLRLFGLSFGATADSKQKAILRLYVRNACVLVSVPFLFSVRMHRFSWLDCGGMHVMLSRVRTMEQILIFGLPEKEVFSRGPPSWVVAGLEPLYRRAEHGHRSGRECMVRLGWRDARDAVRGEGLRLSSESN
jgi:hypothetical protein